MKQFEADLQKLNVEIDIMKIVQSIKNAKAAMNRMMKYMINIQESMHNNQSSNDESKIEGEMSQHDSRQHQESKSHQKHSIKNIVEDNSISNYTIHQNRSSLIAQKVEKVACKRQNEKWYKYKNLPIQNIDKNIVPYQPVSNINNIIEREISEMANESKAEDKKEENMQLSMHKLEPIDNSFQISDQNASRLYDFKEFDRILEDQNEIKYL